MNHSQLNIRNGDKVVTLEGPLKNWYYDQRRLFSKLEDSLNRTDLERKQKLISAGYIHLEAVNIDEEFVKDLKEMQLWLNEKGEKNIHQYTVVTRPDGVIFRIGNKFAKTKKIFWKIQEKIEKGNATDLQKKKFHYIREHLPLSASWKQVKCQRKGESPIKMKDNTLLKMTDSSSKQPTSIHLDKEKKLRRNDSSDNNNEKQQISEQSQSTSNEKGIQEVMSSTSASARALMAISSNHASGAGIWDVPRPEKKSKETEKKRKRCRKLQF